MPRDFFMYVYHDTFLIKSFAHRYIAHVFEPCVLCTSSP